MTRNNTQKEQATAQSLSDCVQLQSELKEIKLFEVKGHMPQCNASI